MAFRDDGHDVIGVELDERFASNELVMDVLDLKPEHIYDYFGSDEIDYIWASPPCTTFSVASLRHHWRSVTDCRRCGKEIEVVSDKVWSPCDCSPGSPSPIKPLRQTPTTEKSKHGLEMIKHTLWLIEEIKPRFFTIENPRAMMRKMPFMQHLERKTITHCQYGDPSRMKPTDLWGGFPEHFEARSCKNGDTCHVAAPRGASTGTQALSGTPESAMVPYDVSREMLEAIKKADA